MTNFFFETSTYQSTVKFRKFNKMFVKLLELRYSKINLCEVIHFFKKIILKLCFNETKNHQLIFFFKETIDNSNHILCSFRVDQTVNQGENYFGSVMIRTRILTEMVYLTILMTTMTTMGFPIAKTTTTMAME